MEEDKKEIELRSAEYQEVLGQPPSWLVRSGTILIAFVLLLLLLLSFVFKYPDIIVSRIVITTINPPAPLKAQVSGKITDVFVKEKQKVMPEEVIAVLENTANYTDYTYLCNILDTLKSPYEFACRKDLNLGECQTSYADFLQTVQLLKNKREIRLYQQQMAIVRQEMADREAYMAQLRKQLEILKQNADFAKIQRERNAMLFEKKAISKYEYEQSEQNFLSQGLLFEEMNSQIISVQLQINKLQQEILDLRKQEDEDYRKAELSIDVAYKTFLSQLDLWKKKYLLVSPIQGRVTFSRYWSKNQAVQVNEVVATIIPQSSTDIIGKLYIPSDGMGKVKEGQRVNIKVDNFPYMEYGFLEGTVKSISLVPITEGDEFAGKSVYCAEVAIPTMESNYRKVFPLTQEMSGVGEIITEDLRLIERLLYPIKSIWKEHF
ncbi:MAG: HlyD family efflux transporter periplasmic adaptor subunit [Bacteroidales bacterium]|nr:HlyD family efflux transporter periplasmic adaptor subunit [Bacteroidales bacterium]